MPHRPKPKPLADGELRRIRRRLGLTQKQLADRLGMHWNSLAKMERGLIAARPSTAALIRMVGTMPAPEPARRRPAPKPRAKTRKGETQ